MGSARSSTCARPRSATTCRARSSRPACATAHAPIFTDDEDYPRHLTIAAEVYCWWLRERRPASPRRSPRSPTRGRRPCSCTATPARIAPASSSRSCCVSPASASTTIADDYAVSGVQLADMLARDRAIARQGRHGCGSRRAAALHGASRGDGGDDGVRRRRSTAGWWRCSGVLALTRLESRASPTCCSVRPGHDEDEHHGHAGLPQHPHRCLRERGGDRLWG